MTNSSIFEPFASKRLRIALLLIAAFWVWYPVTTMMQESIGIDLGPLYSGRGASFVGIGNPPMNFLNCKISGSDIVVSDSLKFSIDGNIEQKISNKSNIVVGIRPEDIHTHSSENTVSVNLKCDFSEVFGDISVHHFTLANQKILVKTSTTESVSSGSNCDLHFKTSSLKLFDSDTGVSIDQ